MEHFEDSHTLNHRYSVLGNDDRWLSFSHAVEELRYVLSKPFVRRGHELRQHCGENPDVANIAIKANEAV